MATGQPYFNLTDGGCCDMHGVRVRAKMDLILIVAAHVRQGAKATAYQDIPRFLNAPMLESLAYKKAKLFLRERYDGAWNAPSLI